MSDNKKTTAKNKCSAGALLFLTSFLLYSLASPGNLPGDTEVRWSVARQMVRGNGVSLEENLRTNNYAVGAQGKRYSFYGLGQSLCLAPFAAAGLIMEKTGIAAPETADLAGQFLASLIFFPMAGAALVWLFYRLVLLLNYNRTTAIVLSAVLAFATMNFHYSTNTQEQTQEGMLLASAILLMVKYRRQRRFVHAWLFCAVLGACLLLRPPSAVTVLPIYLVAAASDIFGFAKKYKLKTTGTWLLAGLLGTGGFIVACGWYNYIRFGSIFESGYELSIATSMAGHGLFEGSPLPALAGMLFSPGKSIFLYNPVLLLFPLCAYSFFHKHKIEAVAAFAAILSNLAFYSFSTGWTGDYAWSIRYQVPLLPFLVLPLAVLFDRPMKHSLKTFLTLLILTSCLIQAASVIYNFNLEFVQNPNHCLIPDNWVWKWPQSHLLKRFENIIRHITGTRDFSSVKVINEEPMLLKYNRSEQSVRNTYVINFFPFKARGLLHSERPFYPLLGIWLILWTGFLISAAKLTRCCRLKAEIAPQSFDISSGTQQVG